MGPTAAGKTALAMAMFDQLPVALISVDSAQVYRGMDIGSAKPDTATLNRYPHALIDIRDPEHPYSAAEFVADAETAMRAACQQGKLPLLVGGTNLYFRALLYGLDDLPAAEPELRARIARQAEQHGWKALHQRLAQRDPDTARGIRPSDPQRIQRALEVLELTGRGLHEHHQKPQTPRFPSLRIVVTAASRARLHARILERSRLMLAQGLIEELEALRQRPGLRADHPAMRSVGYRQVWDYLDGAVSRSELPVRIAAATRQLAKRQLTGLRKFAQTLWYDQECVSTIDAMIRRAAGFAALATSADLVRDEWQAGC